MLTSIQNWLNCAHLQEENGTGRQKNNEDARSDTDAMDDFGELWEPMIVWFVLWIRIYVTIVMCVIDYVTLCDLSSYRDILSSFSCLRGFVDWCYRYELPLPSVFDMFPTRLCRFPITDIIPIVFGSDFSVFVSVR